MSDKTCGGPYGLGHGVGHSVWTRGGVDSGKCVRGDDVNFGMYGPGNAWTQGRVRLGELGSCGLGDV